MKINACLAGAMAMGLVTLSGCATSVKDTTPQQPTMVIKGNYSINGLYLPDSSGRQTVYTRSDMRRMDNAVEHDSFVMGWADYDVSDIYRMDRNLLWSLDNDQESYRECPLGGCQDNPLFALESLDGEDSDGEADEYESYEARGCEVALKDNLFEVTATGNQRVISGYDVSEYVVKWQVDYADEQGRVDSNLLQFVFWTTEPDAAIDRAWEVHLEATEKYYQAIDADHPLARLIGAMAYKTLDGFMTDLDQIDAGAASDIVAQLATIEGYPLATKLEWFQRTEACPEPAGSRRSTDIDLSQGVDGLTQAASNMFGNFLDDQKQAVIDDWKKDALIRYVYEATSVSEEMIHDSKFLVPQGYTLNDRQ